MITSDSTLVNIRCPLYGFISLTEWQRAIVDHPAYQRLRRIRQLGMADLVYPSVTHTRFEHSLGVFYMATQLFDNLRARSGPQIKKKLGMSNYAMDRMRHLVQIAALCHDLGHGPLSHLSELLMPRMNRRRLSHENYSAAIVQEQMRDVIDDHPANRNWRITAKEVADFLTGKNLRRQEQFWRRILSGQVDADRMDYLLRDSLHAGVKYGHYDWPRVLLTVAAVERPNGLLTIGVEEGGWHAAETLLLARYASFTQIYYHRTLVVFEYFARKALEDILPKRRLPGLDQLEEYLKWDDWRFWGELAAGAGGQWGELIRRRQPYGVVFSTPESPSVADEQRLRRAKKVLGELCAHCSTATKSKWYGSDSEEIMVRLAESPGALKPLSKLSRTVDALPKYKQTRLYVERKNLKEARRLLSGRKLI